MDDLNEPAPPGWTQLGYNQVLGMEMMAVVHIRRLHAEARARLHLTQVRD